MSWHQARHEAFRNWLAGPCTVRQGSITHLYDAFYAGWKAAKEDSKKPIDMRASGVPITIEEIGNE